MWKANTVGERLRMLRGKRSLATFAEGLGIHPNTLSCYENDRRRPDTEFLTRLCKREGVEPNWILGFSDVKKSEPLPYRPLVLQSVAAEIARQAPLHTASRLGKLMTLAYERAVVSGASRRQVEQIVRDLVELLSSTDSYEDGIDRIAC